MEFLKNYVVLIVVGLCLCTGYIIKNLLPSDKINRYIPLIMGVLGAVLNIWLNDFSITPEILLGGTVSGLSSTGLHQIFKQFVEKSE